MKVFMIHTFQIVFIRSEMVVYTVDISCFLIISAAGH